MKGDSQMYAIRHIDTNNMTLPPPTPYYMRHFQIFDKIHSFVKIYQMSLTAKKVNYIFEEALNLNNNC